MTALIQLTLDGSLVHEGHKVSLRVLSRTMLCIQAAADRAFLDVHYGNVWKHQRLHRSFYDEADFIVSDPREGSYIVEFLSNQGQAIVKRVRAAITDPYSKAIAAGGQQILTIGHQIEARKGAVENKILVPQDYDGFVAAPDDLITRTYGDKSINKEIAQMLSPVRKDPDAFLKLVLKPDNEERAETFEFNQATSLAFAKIIGNRQLGSPVIYHGHLRQLDRGHNQKSNFKGKFINSRNDKDIVIFIQSEEDFLSLVPHLDGGELKIIACPIIEYDSFDPVAGDIQFLEIFRDG